MGGVTYVVSLSDGVILSIEKEISTITGYTADELIGRSIWNFYENMALRDQLLTELSIYGSLKDYHVKFRDKNGEFIDFLLDTSLVFKDGQPVKVAGTIKKL